MMRIFYILFYTRICLLSIEINVLFRINLATCRVITPGDGFFVLSDSAALIKVFLHFLFPIETFMSSDKPRFIENFRIHERNDYEYYINSYLLTVSNLLDNNNKNGGEECADFGSSNLLQYINSVENFHNTFENRAKFYQYQKFPTKLLSIYINFDLLTA